MLYLQMDNCSRENKNKAMFAYLSWLVESRVFKMVHVGFLIVGCAKDRCLRPLRSCFVTYLLPILIPIIDFCCFRHTHGAVDQCFSCISRLLHRVDAITLPELAAAAVKAFTKNKVHPEVYYLEETADVWSWLRPYANMGSEFKDVTGSHQYVFKCMRINGVDKAVMECKHFAACLDDKTYTTGSILKVSVVKLVTPPFARL